MSKLILPSTTLDDIKMVIFDKDGTLIDVHHYWCSMIEYRAKFFIEKLKDENINSEALYEDLIDSLGIDLESKRMKPEGPVGIKPRTFIIEVALNTILKYVDNYTKEAAIDVFAEVDEYSKSKLSEIIKPLNGVIEFLEALKQNNILSSIATTDITSRAILAMKNLNLEKNFIDIVGADLVINAKPNSDLVDFIVNKNNLKYDQVVVIGDSMADLNMAKNAKCKFIGVKTGLFNNEFIELSDLIINDLTELRVM